MRILTKFGVNLVIFAIKLLNFSKEKWRFCTLCAKNRDKKLCQVEESFEKTVHLLTFKLKCKTSVGHIKSII